MKSYALALWLLCVGLEGLLLGRSWSAPWLRKYPFFFGYVACVFIQDVFFLVIYFFRFSYYRPIYWWGEGFSLIFGCGVSWEIFRLVLGRYPGAGRMARNVLLLALIIVFTKSLSNLWNGELPWPSTALELERNLRAIQALSLIVLSLVCVYYEVPVGRNVRGIFAGYGLFIGMSVVTLTLRAYFGTAFQTGWAFLQPFCYTAALLIWCSSLWKYETALPPQVRPRLEADYRSFVLGTRKGLLQARAFLSKAMRP